MNSPEKQPEYIQPDLPIQPQNNLQEKGKVIFKKIHESIENGKLIKTKLLDDGSLVFDEDVGIESKKIEADGVEIFPSDESGGMTDPSIDTENVDQGQLSEDVSKVKDKSSWMKEWEDKQL